MRPDRGVGLAEVAVALVVVATAWAATVGLHRLALRTVTELVLREEVRWTLQAVADSVEADSAPSTGRLERPWGHVEWLPHEGGVRYEAWIAREGEVLGEALWGGPGGPR